MVFRNLNKVLRCEFEECGKIAMTKMDAKKSLKQKDGVNPIIFFLLLKKCFVTIPLVDDLILI